MVIERSLGRSSVGTIESGGKTKGYFIGHFIDRRNPEYSKNCEVLVMFLPEVDNSKPHCHKKMTEVTGVISGQLELYVWDKGGVYGIKLNKRQYLILEPGSVLQNPRNKEGTEVFVVKFPSIEGDKEYVELDEIEQYLLSC